MRRARGRWVLLALMIGQLLVGAQGGLGQVRAAAVPASHGSPAASLAAHGTAPPPPRYLGHRLKPASARIRRHRVRAPQSTTGLPGRSGSVTPFLLLQLPRPSAHALLLARGGGDGHLLQVPSQSLPPMPPANGATGSQVKHMRRAVTTYVVTTTPATPCASGQTELNLGAALAAAMDGDTIDICPGTYGVPDPTAGATVSQSNLIIQGMGADPSQVVVDASKDSSGNPQSGAVGFTITGSGDVLQNLTVTNATSSGVFVNGTGAGVTLNQVVATANTQAGLMVNGGLATVTSSHFDNNNFGGTGKGAVVLGGGTLNATGSSFDGNFVGILPTGQPATISLTSSSTVDNNRWAGVDIQGGGSLTSTGTTFDNDALAGLAVAVPAGGPPTTLSVSGGEAKNNTGVTGVSGYGYGIGVVSATATTIDLSGMTVSGNITGIALVGKGTVAPGPGLGLVNDTVQGNAGDGLSVTAPAPAGTIFTITGGTYGASGTPNGANGIELVGITATLSGVSADYNTNSGLTVNGGTATVTSSHFDNNNFGGTGKGAVVLGGGTLNATGSSFDGNFVGILPTGQPATISLTSSSTVDNNRWAGVDIQGGGSLTSTGTTFDNDALAGLAAAVPAGGPPTTLSVSGGEANNNTGVTGVSGYGYGIGVVSATATTIDLSGMTVSGNITGIALVGKGTVAPGPGLGLVNDTVQGNAGDGLSVTAPAPAGTIFTITGGTYGASGTPNGANGINIGNTSMQLALSGVAADYNTGIGLLDAGTGPISITGTSSFDNNLFGIFIIPTLVATTTTFGNVTIGDGTNLVTASHNTDGGIYLLLLGTGTPPSGTDTLAKVAADNNGFQGLYDERQIALTISGTSDFSTNGDAGIDLEPQSSGSNPVFGNVTIGDGTNPVTANGNDTTCPCSDGIDIFWDGTHALTNVSANNNLGDGLNDGGEAAITIKGTLPTNPNSTFNGNQYSGIDIDSDLGVTIGDSNSHIDVSGNGTGTTYGDGIDLFSGGLDSITGVAAVANAGDGLYDDGSAALSIACSAFGDNPSGKGVLPCTYSNTLVVGTGPCAVGSAHGNGQYGLDLENGGALTIDMVFANENCADGLYTTDGGDLALSNSSIGGNGGDGVTIAGNFTSMELGSNLFNDLNTVGLLVVGNSSTGLFVSGSSRGSIAIDDGSFNGNGLTGGPADGITIGAGQVGPVYLGDPDGCPATVQVDATLNATNGLSDWGPNTLSVVCGQFSNNLADGLLMACAGKACGLNLNASLLQGNTNGAGLEIAAGAVKLSTRPFFGSDTNLLNGNRAGVLFSAPGFATLHQPTTVSGALVHNDITGNVVGIDVDPTESLLPSSSGGSGSGIGLSGLTVQGNAIFGGGACFGVSPAFGCVPSVTGSSPPFELTTAAQPTVPPYPDWYGYANVDSMDANAQLNLTGNDLGIGGSFIVGDFDALYATPSVCSGCTLGFPPATGKYYDIMSSMPYNPGSGRYIALNLSASGASLVSGNTSNSTVQVNATFNDGAGHNALDGTPIQFTLYDTNTGQFVPPTNITTNPLDGTTLNGALSAVLTYPTQTSNDTLIAIATAPDRMVADTRFTQP